ncbi:MAG: cytochrome c [Desulfuromonadales bacterium]
MKHTAKLIACLALVAMATVAIAAEGGNPKKGKYLYKKTCKTCHVAGSEGKAMTPLSKTQAQWDRFFNKNGHPNQADSWKGLSEQDIKDINQFLFDHAADSDQPETCG